VGGQSPQVPQEYFQDPTSSEAQLQQGRLLRTARHRRCYSPPIQIYYPSFPYLLTNEIHDRKGRQQFFNEQEMWYLLFSMAKAKKQNEINEQLMGDIRPNNIFLNEEGSIKLPNRDSWPYEKSKL
jgi:hypothetical protein